MMDKRIAWQGLDNRFSAFQWVIVLTIVAAMHFAVFMAWLEYFPKLATPNREIEATLLVAPVTHAKIPQLKLLSRVVRNSQPRDAKPAPEVELEQVAVLNKPQVPVSATAEAAPVHVILPESQPVEQVAEPEFKASYLDNRLIYPQMARRMGIQGRVVLNVEVMADGVCGEADVAKSSGHEVLDRAALESVKAWHFIPARHGTQAVTRWFKVPVTFSLMDGEA